ncbi:hypothetical protein L249_2733 [Ophiocordyceps polyrhachis-furcata BCC 54312]|uniref:DUF3500 domain-containing protein n=1 Tax=Ophiocordyceps polyrhachis-furcata BCC 54312 TaxID=1330021 RepID=A0A367LNE4_9HYPO|nr:hypothetical protein L249_2733 [Ophiocordyceps polyrhachis-furcata BCC 54312]
MSSSFRAHLPDLRAERFLQMQKQDAHEYGASFLQTQRPAQLYALYQYWRKLLAEPFKGITNDGKVRHGLFTLEDEGLPIDHIVATARTALDKMSPDQRRRSIYHIDSCEWRTWTNPEFLLSDKGIRLDQVSPELREAVMAVLKATLSPDGYAQAVGAMRINGFLGEMVASPAVINEFSYNLVLFGPEPSAEAPWGFALYGHHLSINAFFYRRQVVLSPSFFGAEPNLIDAGPHAGTRILADKEAAGLALMRSLPPETAARARVYHQLRDPAMPPGRWNPDDQRHLCGAYRDNRLVPYEGVRVSDLGEEQQELAAAVIESHLMYIPERSRRRWMAAVRSWFGETFFCWIGGSGDDDAFYYRAQSPVVIVEFDHHSGIFLTNSEPARFHIHSIVRMPNGGDYGMALRQLIPGGCGDFVWEPESHE